MELIRIRVADLPTVTPDLLKMIAAIDLQNMGSLMASHGMPLTFESAVTSAIKYPDNIIIVSVSDKGILDGYIEINCRDPKVFYVRSLQLNGNRRPFWLIRRFIQEIDRLGRPSLLCSRIIKDNRKSIAFHEKLGFTVEESGTDNLYQAVCAWENLRARFGCKAP
jgi:Ni,Fe-hydrogenase I small subunit